MKAKMLEVINASILAQMANDQIEEVEVSNLIKEQCESIALRPDGSEEGDYDRLFAANRLNKASKAVLDKFRERVIGLMKKLSDNESITKIIGSRMYKFYYTLTTHFERVHLPELTAEQIEKMTPEQLKLEGMKRDMLDEQHELYHEIEAIEKALSPKKIRLKGLNEALAVMMPDSKAIKRTPVLQVSTVVE
ncbi:MAG: hypothetical protein K6E94_01585 [Elusimicrobiaceae bacterium]|nr:hypothetical protein [Elusimicrobiaceae bacterium]